MREKYQDYMLIAIEQAESSLRQGNKGFGTVIVKNDKIISAAHDTDNTDSNPLAHAEVSAIKKAVDKIGPDLSGCLLFSTHEPCPMCSGAIIWSRISEVFYGFSIKDSLLQGKKMVNIGSDEILKKAPWKILVNKNFLKEECSHLYNKDVKKMVKRFLQCLKDKNWDILEEEYINKRKDWFYKNRTNLINSLEGGDIDKAYQLLLIRLQISKEEAPIVKKGKKEIIFRSKNFCPTIAACKILNLDTRKICKAVFERPAEELLKNINPEIRFTRNYDKIRPYECFCEEKIYMG